MPFRNSFCNIIIFLSITLFSCNSKPKVKAQFTYELEDGKYCSEIQYFNPSSGEQSTYNLYVDVKNDTLVKIYWPNGGWLDESHFEPTKISNRYTEFESDKGYEYKIQLRSNDANCEQCYSEISEEIKHDSIMNAIELQKLEYDLELAKTELELKSKGFMVMYTGCKDLLYFYNGSSWIVAQKLDYRFNINAGDRIDCEVTKTGIVSIGNLTNHSAGNIRVLDMVVSRGQAETILNEVCTENMKTWDFN